MESKHDVSVALDGLLVEMLCLIEQKVQAQVNVENVTKNGSIHLAKSRYIMGQNTVSRLQLPTENAPDFSALAKVDITESKDDDVKCKQFTLMNKESETNSSYINPVKWFGVLVPQNLHQAQSIFKKGLEYVVESVNIDEQLNEICNRIIKFKSLKDKLTPEE